MDGENKSIYMHSVLQIIMLDFSRKHSENKVQDISLAMACTFNNLMYNSCEHTLVVTSKTLCKTN